MELGLTRDDVKRLLEKTLGADFSEGSMDEIWWEGSYDRYREDLNKCQARIYQLEKEKGEYFSLLCKAREEIRKLKNEEIKTIEFGRGQ